MALLEIQKKENVLESNRFTGRNSNFLQLAAMRSNFLCFLASPLTKTRNTMQSLAMTSDTSHIPHRLRIQTRVSWNPPPCAPELLHVEQTLSSITTVLEYLARKETKTLIFTDKTPCRTSRSLKLVQTSKLSETDKVNSTKIQQSNHS